MNNTFGSSKNNDISMVETLVQGKIYCHKVYSFFNQICVYFKEIEKIENKQIRAGLSLIYSKDCIKKWEAKLMSLRNKYSSYDGFGSYVGFDGLPYKINDKKGDLQEDFPENFKIREFPQ